jgi:TPR repeat protein
MRTVVTDCDRLAAYPWDPHGANGVSGVAFGKIDIVPALTACNEAMRQYPDVARFVFQAGRIAFQQKDYVLARQYFEKAIAMGSDAGMAGLGFHYQYGLGVSQNYNEARRWYEKGAAAGIPGAMNYLGSLYEAGTGVAKDYNEARKWYEKAAAAGEPNAMRNLGNLYQNGNGVPQDKQTARKWYEQAAAAGDDKSKDLLKTLDAAAAPTQPPAGPRPTGSADPLMRDVVTDCDRLAAYPFDPQRPTGVSGVVFGKIDIVPALKACNEAMRQYPDVARFVYQTGRITFQQGDYVLARQYFEKAVVKGSGSGRGALGTIYENGLGVQRDNDEARRWYEKGVAAGEPYSMNRLGFLYETGAGVAKDFGEARKLYEKAAAAGEPNAMRNLGNLYQNGNGVPQDKQTARKWYEQAAAAGDDKSKDLLKTLDAASAQAQPR